VGSFLGVRGILRQRPTGKPTSVEPRRGLSPRVAAGDRSERIVALVQLKRSWDLSSAFSSEA
jgi:hypothetical protein